MKSTINYARLLVVLALSFSYFSADAQVTVALQDPVNNIDNCTQGTVLGTYTSNGTMLNGKPIYYGPNNKFMSWRTTTYLAAGNVTIPANSWHLWGGGFSLYYINEDTPTPTCALGASTWTGTFGCFVINVSGPSCSAVNGLPDPPVIICPANVVMDNDPGQCGAVVPTTANASDGLVTYSPAAGTLLPIGTTTVTSTAENAGGSVSCSFDVTVNDTEAPVVANCQDITVQLDAFGEFSMTINFFATEFGVTDNCSINSGGVTGTAVRTCADIGTNPVTYYFNDAAGNSSQCDFMLTVEDPLSFCNAPPVAVCQNLTIDADANCQGSATAADFNDGSTDPDDDPITFSVSPAGPYPLGTSNVTLTVTDDSNASSTCAASITVVDVTAPTITNCPQNTQVNLGTGECIYTLPTYASSVTLLDNCDPIYSQFPAIGAELGVGTHAISLTVTDSAGLTDECSFDLTIGRDPNDPTTEYTCAPDPTAFITTWQTDNPGASGDNSITIPTQISGIYAYDVDWDNDGTYDQLEIEGSVTHTYATAGQKTIQIRGKFGHIFFNEGGDKDKLLSVDQWGAIEWRSFENAFHSCENMNVLAADAPDLSQVTNVSKMFTGCSSLDADVNDWDMSTIETTYGMFEGCTLFNSPLDEWDVSAVTDMAHMLQSCPAFDQDLSAWDVSSVEDMHEMLLGSELSTDHYDALLISWAAQALQADVAFDGGMSQYCDGGPARQSMITSDGWSIEDGGQSLGCLIPIVNPCPEDFNQDGQVGISDFILMNSEFGMSIDTPCDLNGDGIVNVEDFVLFNGQYGSSCPTLNQGLIPSNEDVILSEQLVNEITTLDNIDWNPEFKKIIDEYIDGLNVQLYPNPNDGTEFKLDIRRNDGEEAMISLFITDVNGRLVHSENIAAKGEQLTHKVSLDSQLESGMYFLRLELNSSVETRKFSVE